jgi:poly-gamma-glutamate capsule biosynthesis protein CapA/YwtB (metallophosphatase superfamily)
MKPLLATADLRFVNLESQLSDQKGETESPRNHLVFTGPPAGADSLAKAGFDVVSLANNHALDYGKKALFETMFHLDRAGVRHAGAGRSRKQAYAPLVVERGGFRLAIVAVTDIWNQAPPLVRAYSDYVAGADVDGLPAVVRAAKRDRSIDAVVVSYHGGVEYVDEPLPRTRALLRAAVDAGADVAIGHHPHIVQGVEWRRGKPILYSLGNFVMQMHSSHPWVDTGFLARVGLERGAPPRVEACPFRADGFVPRPLSGDAQRGADGRRFFERLEQISAPLGGVTIAKAGDDGCALLSAPAGEIP